MANNGMTKEEAERNAVPMFDEYREQYDRGDPLGMVQAVRLALMWSLPVPEWAAEHARRAIEEYYERNRGAPGVGKTGGLKTQGKRYAVHAERHRVVEHEIARGKAGFAEKGSDAALERARDRLAHTPAATSLGGIERSRTQMRKKLGPKKSG